MRVPPDSYVLAELTKWLETRSTATIGKAKILAKIRELSQPYGGPSKV